MNIIAKTDRISIRQEFFILFLYAIKKRTYKINNFFLCIHLKYLKKNGDKENY